MFRNRHACLRVVRWAPYRCMYNKMLVETLSRIARRFLVRPAIPNRQASRILQTHICANLCTCISACNNLSVASSYKYIPTLRSVCRHLCIITVCAVGHIDGPQRSSARRAGGKGDEARPGRWRYPRPVPRSAEGAGAATFGTGVAFIDGQGVCAWPV